MKIALITGANSGLGYASTQALLKEDYYIYMACRSEAKALEAINTFDSELREKVEYIHCDLISFDSIRACADHILKNEKQLSQYFKKNLFSNEIIIGMGAGVISKWVAGLKNSL